MRWTILAGQVREIQLGELGEQILDGDLMLGVLDKDPPGELADSDASDAVQTTQAVYCPLCQRGVAVESRYRYPRPPPNSPNLATTSACRLPGCCSPGGGSPG